MKKIVNKIQENKWIILILLVAVILRLYKIDFQSLWMDEIYTLNVASSKNSFSTIISEVNLRESFPYLYFFIMNAMFTLFGDTSIVARIPSVIFGVMGVWMIYKLGKELYSKNTGLISAALLTINEYHLYHSQDARAYSIYIFSIILSYYFLIKFLKDNCNKNLINYILSVALLLNVNFFSPINVIAQGFLLFGFFIFIPTEKRKLLTSKLIIIVVAFFLSFLPNIYKFYLLSKFKSSWIPAPTNDGLTKILFEFTGNSELIIFIIGLLFTHYIIKIFNQKKTNNLNQILENKMIFSYILSFVWIFTVVFVIILKSYTSNSLYISRYFSSLLPIILILISISIVNIKNIIIKASFILILLVFSFFNLIIVKGYYKTPNKAQFREASQLIIEKNKKNDEVFTGLKYWFDFYLSKFKVTEKANLESLVNEMMNNPSLIKPFWYVDAHGRPFELSDNAQQFVAKTFYVDENFDGFDSWTKHYILLKDVKKDIDITKFGKLTDYNGTPFKFNIEVFENTNNIIKTSGWAYFEGQDAKENTIDIVLINENGKATKIPAEKVSRPDVTSYFNSSFDVSNSGFSVVYNIEELTSGNYKLGIIIENKLTKKLGLNLTDKTIKK
jgi:hypothetical protein